MSRTPVSPLEPRFTVPDAVASALAAIDRARDFLASAELPERWARRERELARRREARHTALLDGAADDARAARGHEAAAKLVSEAATRGEPLTEERVAELRRLADGAKNDGPKEGGAKQGAAKKAAAKNGGAKPVGEPDATRVRALVEWLASTPNAHPVLIAGVAQQELARCGAGGRASRLAAAWCLARAGYDFAGLYAPSEGYGRESEAFQRALASASEPDADRTPWLAYFAAALARHATELKARAHVAVQSAAMATAKGLNPRQADALHLLVCDGEVTLAQLLELHPGAEKAALERDLRDMVEQGLMRDADDAAGRFVFEE